MTLTDQVDINSMVISAIQLHTTRRELVINLIASIISLIVNFSCSFKKSRSKLKKCKNNTSHYRRLVSYLRRCSTDGHSERLI